MSLTPEQFHERVVDYLYGMLDGDELRAFEESLRGSGAYQRELEALRETLSRTRGALRGPLASAPPERARRAVLAAAEAAVARPTPRIASEAESPFGLWAFLRRPWLFPAVGVAAACAIAIVMVRRVDRGEEPTRAPSAPSAVASPSEQSPAGAAEPRAEPFPASPRGSAREEAMPESEGIGRLGTERSRARAPKPARTRVARRPEVLDRAPKGATPPPVSAATPVRASESKAARDARPIPAAAMDDERADRGRSEEMPALESDSRAAGAAPSAAPSAAPTMRREAEVEELAAPRDVLLRRARVALSERRYAVAASAYRALLARFPNDPERETWRDALETAERAARDAAQ